MKKTIYDLKLRRRLFKWMNRNVFKVEDGAVYKGLSAFVLAILFPVQWFIRNQGEMRYDPWTRTYTIKGMRYSHNFFESMSEGGISLGVPFIVTSRGDGYITTQLYHCDGQCNQTQPDNK